MANQMLTIGDIAEIFDGPHATPKKIENGPYFLSISSLEDGRLDLSKSAHVSEEQFVKWTKRVTPQKSDLLFSYETRLGEAALMPEGVRACLGRRMGLLRPKLDKVIPEYLLYAYISPFFQQVIKANTIVGATVDRIALSEMKDFPIRIPNLSEQKAACLLLSTIDKKIELNNRINSELEAMAKLLYDYWFVQFDFPDANGKPYKASGGKMVYNDTLKREIPDGWDLIPLEYFADVIDPHPSHRAPKEVEHGFPFAGIGDIDESGNIAISKARKIDEEFVDKQERDYAIGDYSLGYGRVGTVGKVVRLKKQKFRYALSPTLSVINPKKPEYAGYIYTVIKSEEFYKNVLKNTSGTTRPAIGIQLLRKIPILKPRNEHADMFERYEKITRELFEKTSIVNQESQELIELRDWLLPMLMNGQVTVKPKTESQEALHG
ncbi:restriction endonuclease subunit S [Vibrio vulnificus]|uniref:restriction endonuclease subunit S n=1 Tax=Vibrio vulnificus TaxID=672 RepID=UPI00215C1DB4|nr:restriction endonuclease subunit S [Vibrio vulnificus]MCR9499369.1 restriction endonuclease subunit S [Vibrio vulnificus]